MLLDTPMSLFHLFYDDVVGKEKLLLWYKPDKEMNENVARIMA